MLILKRLLLFFFIQSIKIFTGITIPSFIISVSLYIYGYTRKRTLKLQENKLLETPRTPENPIITIERDTPEQFRSRPGDSEVRKSLLESSARRLKNIGRRPGDIRPSGLLGNISDEDYWSKKRPSELQERVSYDEYY